MISRWSALALCCLLTTGATADELADDALSLLLQGIDAGSKTTYGDLTGYYSKREECNTQKPVPYCTVYIDFLRITGKCTAERTIEQFGSRKDTPGSHASMMYLLKYDLSKVSVLTPVDVPDNTHGTKTYLNLGGSPGFFCHGHEFSIKWPTKFDCVKELEPLRADILGWPLIGSGPAVAERARKAAAYCRGSLRLSAARNLQCHGAFLRDGIRC